MSLLLPDRLLPEDEDGNVSAKLSWARSPLYEPVLYLFVLVTGVYGSIHGPMILDGLGSFVGPSSPDFNPEATRFTLLAGITSLLYGLQRWSLLLQREAQNRTYNNSQQRLEDSTDRLEESTRELRLEIRTMPPENFLDAFGQVFRKMENTVQSLLIGDPPDPELVRRSIRVLLENFAEIAQLFDGNPSEAYHANVMTYHTPSEFKEQPQVAEALQRRLTFARGSADVRRTRGILDLRCDLSTRTPAPTEDSAEPDPSLSPLVLEIPNPIREGGVESGRYYALPGAPIAWANRYADQYANTEELLNWYQTHCVKDDFVEQEIRSYFAEEDPEIGSFLACSLIYDEGSEDPIDSDLVIDDLRQDENDVEVPIGVLNLHRASGGILKDNPEAGEYFLTVTRPLRILCTRLLYLLREVEHEKHGTWWNLTETWPHQTGWSDGPDIDDDPSDVAQKPN
jgi:hypothetical protein